MTRKKLKKLKMLVNQILIDKMIPRKIALATVKHIVIEIMKKKRIEFQEALMLFWINSQVIFFSKM
jgi:hypothetical protein